MKKAVPFVLLFGVALSATALSADPKTTFNIVNTAPFSGKNYNPFTPGSNHLPPTLSAIYESLFYINALDGKATPVLGTKYT